MNFIFHVSLVTNGPILGLLFSFLLGFLVTTPTKENFTNN